MQSWLDQFDLSIDDVSRAHWMSYYEGEVARQQRATAFAAAG